MRLLQDLRDSEAQYRGAVIAGRMASWETDMVARTRIWTQEGMALFGVDLPGGRGQIGTLRCRSPQPRCGNFSAGYLRLSITKDKGTAPRGSFAVPLVG